MTLENFDPFKPKARLNSPRSVDACKRQGIDPQELLYLALEEYKEKVKDKRLDKDSLKIRWEHHEEKRKEKLRVLIEVTIFRMNF